jgi:aminodeoxychorismate lyase
MIVFFNGQFVPEEEAKVSIFDRAFLYGDGLFETIRVSRAIPFRLEQHVERLQRGAQFLGIRLPFQLATLQTEAAELIRRVGVSDAALRITVSRGVGGRGYLPKDADKPVIAMTLHPAPTIDPLAPAQWRLVTSSFRLAADDPLATFKTANKLRQIMARAEAEDRGADEALLLNTEGHFAEGAASNLFWIERGAVCTPPLTAGALAGITRGVVQEICEGLGIASTERICPRESLQQAEGVFLSLSSLGVSEAASLDGQPLPRCPMTRTLHQKYQELLAAETRVNESRRSPVR